MSILFSKKNSTLRKERYDRYVFKQLTIDFLLCKIKYIRATGTKTEKRNKKMKNKIIPFAMTVLAVIVAMKLSKKIDEKTTTANS